MLRFATLIASTVSAAGLFAAASVAHADPHEVCTVAPAHDCSNGSFAVIEKTYHCPKTLQVNSPVNGELSCATSASHTVTCDAFPVEVPEVCGSSGKNLIYNWNVTIGGVSYPYPPSYDAQLSISCIPPERIFVSVDVENGSAHGFASYGLRCGDAEH